MYMMMSQQLLDLVFHGREERNLEYKPSLSWSDRSVQDKTAKSAMALANIRDGGAIVFGVAQQGDDFVPVGMTPNDAASFNNDDVIAYVNKYADPYVELSVSQVTTEEGKRFVVIQVREFAEIPVVCKRDGTERLTKGAIYIRTRRMPETAVVPSQTEMRELVELAVEK